MRRLGSHFELTSFPKSDHKSSKGTCFQALRPKDHSDHSGIVCKTSGLFGVSGFDEL